MSCRLGARTYLSSVFVVVASWGWGLTVMEQIAAERSSRTNKRWKRHHKTSSKEVEGKPASATASVQASRVPGGLRKRVSDQLELLLSFEGDGNKAQRAEGLVSRLDAFLNSPPLQDPAAAKFREYMVDNYIGDPSHVLDTSCGVASSYMTPPFPAHKWSKALRVFLPRGLDISTNNHLKSHHSVLKKVGVIPFKRVRVHVPF